MWTHFFKTNGTVNYLVSGFLIVILFLTVSPLAVLAEQEGADVSGSEAELPVTIAVFSDNQIPTDGDSLPAGVDAPSTEVTGGVSTSSENEVVIQTGAASAGALLSTDVNSNEIQSYLGTSTSPEDLDTYTLMATGTNEAFVTNEGSVVALTGNNDIESASAAMMETGDAMAVLNIANVINTNVINSTGFIALLNEVVEGVTSWNLQDLFFPADATLPPMTAECSLLSCAAEDVVYSVSNTNTGVLNNDVQLDAISGKNSIVAPLATINTGNAYSAANVINIANTNIIDSNYRLLTVNGIGTLDGDLVLPTEALFRAFFGQVNGLNQVEDPGDATITDNNQNTAVVSNNLNTVAESGLNNATTSFFGTTTTGKASALSNVVNQVNQNLFGGDSMYLLIRVHGVWNGNVFGLPEGLSWLETDEGIVIHNTGSEIVPSEILHYDHDSYTANFNNNNDITINNNLDINAVTGENDLDGDVAVAKTGEAYAGANVLNIANTNVVGRNWILAIMNIFGDFTGNISFGRPDLWVGGQVQSLAAPVGPGAKLVYTYTVTNKGDLKATDVKLRHNLQSSYIKYTGGQGEALKAHERDELIGTLMPGETRVVSFDAYVDDQLAVGTTTVSAEAKLSLRESDQDKTNNSETITLAAVYALPVVVVGGGSGGGGSSGSGGGGGTGSSGGGSGSGVAGSPKGQVLGRSSKSLNSTINPKSAPKISVKKTANVLSKQIVQAGQDVTYAIVITNSGGTAYNSRVFDQLLNPIGAVVNEQFWDVGTIAAGEIITFDYTIKFATTTPSGLYTNTVKVEAYRDVKGVKKPIKISDAVHTIEINGQTQSIGNVGITMFVPMGNGKLAALVAWETIKPTDGQVFFARQGTSTPFDTNKFNYGYTHSSYQSKLLATRHFIVLTGLDSNTTYTYRLRSADSAGAIVSNEYTFVVPAATTITMLQP